MVFGDLKSAAGDSPMVLTLKFLSHDTPSVLRMGDTCEAVCASVGP